MRLTYVVGLMQLVVLVTFETDPHPPRSPGLFQLIWAWFHEPSFYPLAALAMVGVPLSIVLGLLKGRHRWWLAGFWAAFAGLVIAFHSERMTTMLRILYQQMT